MRGSGKLLGGVLLGAGAMYVLDPDRGARRRSLLRDQGFRASRKLGEGVGATARDVRNRSAGAAAELASRLKRDQAGDEIVLERVRSALGRVASHAAAIEVSVYNRRVILSGPVPAAELDAILSSIRRVRGVREVENQLEVYHETEGVPSLQGSGRQRLGRRSLSPTTRLLMGTLGSAATVAGVKGRGGLGTLLSVLGLASVAQAVLNLSIDRGPRPEPSERPGASGPEAAAGYQASSASTAAESLSLAPE